jgi:hypothetical protein
MKYERCRETKQYSDDWHLGLYPECADQTEGDGVCRRCSRHGAFEMMGGDGKTDPTCCDLPCVQMMKA